jgi:hypothetical protein
LSCPAVRPNPSNCPKHDLPCHCAHSSSYKHGDHQREPLLTSTPGNAEGAIFVQCNKVNDFKAACSGEQFTLDVSEHFQYGQDKAQTKRFLVFHDKGNKAYQVRDEHAGVVLEGLTV